MLSWVLPVGVVALLDAHARRAAAACASAASGPDELAVERRSRAAAVDRGMAPPVAVGSVASATTSTGGLSP